MASDPKTIGLECGAAEVDRISQLPTNLIDLILECLPTHDAARTCVLSKTWRNIWGMHPRLCFDDKFMLQLVSHKFSQMDEQTQTKEVSTTISHIFLAHSGPILDFLLNIPEDLPLHQSSDIILWIKNISNNGVRKLNFVNDSLVACKMPSHFFACSQLTHLCLINCILNPPLGFGGFCNLISVELMYVTINADMSFGTKLEELDIDICFGIKHLGRQFKCDNNLTVLSISYIDEIDWQWFECTQMLQVLRLAAELPSSVDKVINLDKLVGNMPRINSLRFDGYILQILGSGASSLKRLTRAMEKLKSLDLHSIDLYDPVQIQSVICLIRSSPNLQRLNIGLQHEVQSTDAMDLLDLTVSSDHMILDRLETLIIFDMAGSRAELQFIKLLLASSPSLRQIELETNGVVLDDPAEELRISREVLQIPRASKAAQIQWKG